ncbi:outer membrane protein [Phaeovulum sp.]|uniref:outer membrane protein n=1 Tax=Phaeovulum sp. TaxID=2934796 RepID=UPI00273097A0|nr:porin family protein [Phaeovulum sp.]MDP1669736.1 porin family protein [Phaeovulum sp.]MDP2063242.1 porin family protein [Phaeovulum sp.]MDP3863018.1 porin family protein [Phaeovulum sp.]MDZ4119024.1 porin family protein [Phaeovulum sp.]
MTKFTISTAAVMLAAMTTTAFAGGYVAPVTEAPVYAPVAVRAHDWSGAYVGLKAGQTSGDWDYNNFLTGTLDSGTTIGGFAGYNMQRGNLVYGAEIGLTHLGVTAPTYPTLEFGNVLEIKGRLGYAMDRVMVYGTLGYMSGTITDTSGPTDYDANGMTYGLGAEFMLTDRIFAGLEYQRAALTGTYMANEVAVDLDTVALRVGFQF